MPGLVQERPLCEFGCTSESHFSSSLCQFEHFSRCCLSPSLCLKEYYPFLKKKIGIALIRPIHKKKIKNRRLYSSLDWHDALNVFLNLWISLVCPSGKETMGAFRKRRQDLDGDWVNLLSIKSKLIDQVLFIQLQISDFLIFQTLCNVAGR